MLYLFVIRKSQKNEASGHQKSGMPRFWLALPEKKPGVDAGMV
jgi:hypothetical protein